MIDSKLKKVQDNNNKINGIVSSIMKMRRDNNITIQVGDKLEPIAEEVFKLVTKNILTIYKAEYTQYGFSECRGSENVSLNNARPGDCAGGTKGLQIGTNLNEFLRRFLYAQLEQYKVQESGAEITEKYNGSERDQMDLFLKFKEIFAGDMDWVMSAIAHEAKHTYGVIGGNTFLKEGITEQTTREDCDKYGMYMEPNAHTQEANFIRKLELIVGREEIVKAGLYNEHIKMKNSEFSKIIEENGEVSFEELDEFFEISRYDDKKIEDYDRKQEDESKKLRPKLEKFKSDYPDLVDRVLAIKEKYDKMNSEDRYESLDKAIQEKLSVDFKKLRNILDNIYSIQMKHKKEPEFYRKLYSDNWGDILKDKDWQILLEVDSLENVDLEQIKQEGIDFYGTGIKVKSYSELMEPINTYIKENNLPLNNENNEINLTEVIEVQEDIVQRLEELYRKQNSMIINQFHDQKSDAFFEDIERGVYCITEQKIGKATINASTTMKDNAKTQVKRDEHKLILQQEGETRSD